MALQQASENEFEGSLNKPGLSLLMQYRQLIYVPKLSLPAKAQLSTRGLDPKEATCITTDTLNECYG